jgi:hypothetical protein
MGCISQIFQNVHGRYIHHRYSTLIAAAEKVAGQIAAMLAERFAAARHECLVFIPLAASCLVRLRIVPLAEPTK